MFVNKHRQVSGIVFNELVNASNLKNIEVNKEKRTLDSKLPYVTYNSAVFIDKNLKTKFRTKEKDSTCF